MTRSVKAREEGGLLIKLVGLHMPAKGGMGGVYLVVALLARAVTGLDDELGGEDVGQLGTISVAAASDLQGFMVEYRW